MPVSLFCCRSKTFKSCKPLLNTPGSVIPLRNELLGFFFHSQTARLCSKPRPLHISDHSAPHPRPNAFPEEAWLRTSAKPRHECSHSDINGRAAPCWFNN